MGKNSDSDKKKDKDFTVDSENSGVVEMPSITTLLDRKTGSRLIKMRKEKEAEKTRVLNSPPPPSPPNTEKTNKIQAPKPTSVAPAIEEGIQIGLDSDAPNGIQFSYSGQTASATADESPKSEGKTGATRVLTSQPLVPPLVQRSKKSAGSQALKDLVKWELKTIQSGKDPIFLALQKILKGGGRYCLFLNVKIADPKAVKIVFEASAGLGEAEHLRLWKGMKWNPHVVAELWNHFVKHGASELSPPGTVTHLASSRNVVRSVFGAKREEWLTLFRVGPAESCRGILAILSKNSLQPLHTEILSALAIT